MHPVLAVADVRASVAFYCDQLGFHHDFIEGDPPIHGRVVADPSYASPTIHIRFEPLEAGQSVNPSVYLWLHVGSGLDELFDVYRKRGVPIVEAPEDRPWGLRQFAIRDLDGYRLEYCAELGAS